MVFGLSHPQKLAQMVRFFLTLINRPPVYATVNVRQTQHTSPLYHMHRGHHQPHIWGKWGSSCQIKVRSRSWLPWSRASELAIEACDQLRSSQARGWPHMASTIASHELKLSSHALVVPSHKQSRHKQRQGWEKRGVGNRQRGSDIVGINIGLRGVNPRVALDRWWGNYQNSPKRII